MTSVSVLAVWWMVELQGDVCSALQIVWLLQQQSPASSQPQEEGGAIIIITLHTLYSVTCPDSVWFEVSCIGDTEHVLLAQ